MSSTAKATILRIMAPFAGAFQLQRSLRELSDGVQGLAEEEAGRDRIAR